MKSNEFIDSLFIIGKNTTFGGVPLGQNWSALFALEKILKEYAPDIIIELGTADGGSTNFLRLFAYVHTYDKVPRASDKKPNVDYKLKDVFEKDTIKEINDIINRHDKIFLFCDNGNKPLEFATYAPLLKKGDLIFVHDYGTEIREENIKPIVKKYKLIPHEKELCDGLYTLLQGWKR